MSANDPLCQLRLLLVTVAISRQISDNEISLHCAAGKNAVLKPSVATFEFFSGFYCLPGQQLSITIKAIRL
jgi:hypothetical protein